MVRHLQVLLLVADAQQANRIQALLAASIPACRVTAAQTREEAETALQSQHADLILADYACPCCPASLTLQLSYQCGPPVPVVFLADSLTAAEVQQLITAGACDVVIGANPSSLELAILRARRERQQGLDRQQEHQQRADFLGMLSHELRNPLAALRNALYLMRLAEPAEAVYEEACTVSECQVKHLSGIVDDLLDVFRLARGQMGLHTEPVELTQLVRRCVLEQRTALEQARLTWNLDMDMGPLWMHGDPQRLTQVVAHLLANAIKFTPAGGHVTLRLTADRPSHQAVLLVRDTGIGLDAATRTQLFDVFTQGPQDLARTQGGLGLGLALVKGLVELHGGSIQAHSGGKDQGTEITIRWPLAEAAPANAAPTGCRHKEERGLRILIVEDNRETARMLSLLLTRQGYCTQMAHTGTAGTVLAREWRPDVVLCDLGLPEKDGFTVARELRQEAELAETHLIAISGYGQAEDRRRSREAGFELHLIKPVDPAELQQILQGLTVEPAE